MSLESLIDDANQFATITAEAPDGSVPAQDPTGAADRSDANWETIVSGVPCLVNPKNSAVQAFPGRNNARMAMIDARIYFVNDPLPPFGISSRNRITVRSGRSQESSLVGIFAVIGTINPNSLNGICEVDCERIRTP
jgi:hypothetical protein